MNQLPETPVSYLKLGPTTKEEIKSFANGVIRSVKDGEVSAMDVHVTLKKLIAAAEIISDAIKANVMKEVELYSEKEFEYDGAKIEKAEVGTKYDYSVCGSTDWERFNSDEQTASSRRKEVEAFLKTLKEPVSVADTQSGEILRPPVKTSTSSIKVTLK